jgi:hypothetical protein|tara:strand:- start:1000 stop:2829 length:1830 start_codon:yes stop_codon:yes gene_type:complete
MEPISEKLFAKIRGRFESVTIGDEQGAVTDEPRLAKYFDFDYKEGANVLGKVSITLDEKSGVTVLFNQDFMAEAGEAEKNNWYNFLKEIRIFSKKHMLNFDTRDITKSNLDKRDYAHLTKTAGETQMSESKMYGTSRTSFEDIDTARLVLKHTKPVNQEVPGSRTQNVHSMYIESEAGERFKYPFRHLNGARAMARHVAEGGNQYDDFGKHIVEMSTELNKLRKFKTYMNRSSVMAEGLKGYMEAVDVRLENIKTEVMKLQRSNYYKETFANFAPVVNENVPEDVAENWIDQLTIRTFNEELKDVFPYVYRLVSEVTTATETTPEDFVTETEVEAEVEEAEVQTPEMEFERALDSIVGEEDNALIDGDEEAQAAAVKQINGLMAQHFPAGINGTNAIESMKGVIDDPMLLDMFKKVGQKDADTCVRPLVMKYLKGKNSNIMNQIDTGDLASESDDDNVPSKKAGDPTTDFTKWLKKNHNKGPRDLSGDEYTKHSKSFQAQKKAKEADDTGTMDVKINPQGQMMHPDTPDAMDGDQGDNRTPGQKLEELVKSYYDYTTNNFPKGEQAVVTACEKEFGENSVPVAEKMIARLMQGKDGEMERIKSLAGINN